MTKHSSEAHFLKHPRLHTNANIKSNTQVLAGWKHFTSCHTPKFEKNLKIFYLGPSFV